jgi:hypothetical protein
VNASLAGELGAVNADGLVTLEPPHWAAENLLLRFSRLDLAALTGGDLSTSLAGDLRVTGGIDTLRAPEGRLELALTRSRIREWTLTSSPGASRDSVIGSILPTPNGRGPRYRRRRLGWGVPHSGRMVFALAADSLIAFDSLLLATTGQRRDTVPERPAQRRAQARVVLEGPRHPPDLRRRRCGTSPSRPCARPRCPPPSPRAAANVPA